MGDKVLLGIALMSGIGFVLCLVLRHPPKRLAKAIVGGVMFGAGSLLAMQAGRTAPTTASWLRILLMGACISAALWYNVKGRKL